MNFKMKCVVVAVLGGIFTSLSGCAVVSVVDTAVSVTAGAVKTAAKVAF